MNKDNRIWIYWDNGVSQAPPLIRASIQSVINNSNCSVKVFDKHEALSFVPHLEPRIFNALRPAHQADVLRISILEKFGGMYIDADTIVIDNLAFLFDQLCNYDLIGADWRPKRYPECQEDIGISVMGPVLPGNSFIKECLEIQASLINKKKNLLLESPWRRNDDNSNYCFDWEELLGKIVVPVAKKGLGKALIFSGADSWFAYVGGPSWHGGDGGHLYRKLLPNEKVLESPLYAYSHSLAPREALELKLPELMSKGWILSTLLSKSGCL
jgi:hypothetical protein